MTPAQLAAGGLSRGAVRAEVRSGRWLLGPGEVVALAPATSLDALAWRAVLATAPRSTAAPRAAVAGVTALHLAGLRGVDGDGVLHLAAPKSSRPVPAVPGWRVHETRRWRDEDVLVDGVPRFRPAVAVLQAAFWARTDREAALLVCAPLQQRLADAAGVAAALEEVRRDRRRRLVHDVLAEFVDGAQSLNEIDLARMCRAAGLPEPDRQVVVRRPRGAYYLDVRWERWRVVVEVDGVQHLALDTWLADSRRHNLIALSGDVVLRVPSLALRLEPQAQVALIAAALRRAGWRG